MSVMTDVLREARTGATCERIAATLGIDPGIADAALDHWVRLGVVLRVGEAIGTSCGGCAPTATGPGGAAASLACAGCVLAPRRV
ncbi:hypothetical protein [Cellulomonas hominis]